LPCAPELVEGAKAGVVAIERRIESVELAQSPASTLSGMIVHLQRLKEVFRRYPAATNDVLEGTLRESTRCNALVDRIKAIGGS
jgi:hypothetical protein